MQEYKVILTWEAIYDVTDIADYIEEEFGQRRADRFQSDLKEQMQNLSQFGTVFPRTQILYRGYSIHKIGKISCCKDQLIHIQNKYMGADRRSL